MPQCEGGPPASLFYSYSHKDAQHRERMETSLSLLKRDELLEDWSDHEILPGQSISSKIRENMDRANILVFLFSPDFLASDECQKEWEFATSLASSGKLVFRIPIVLRECAWKDMLGNDDAKALPKDGHPVSGFPDEDSAWQEVFEGIKSVVCELRKTFSPRPEFLDELDKTDFLSQSHLALKDLFIFPRLASEESQGSDQPLRDTAIKSDVELLSTRYSLIHGQEKAGKSALARHLCRYLIEDSQPVVLVDLTETPTSATDGFLRDVYGAQFNGDYSLWTRQCNKTLILDNMNATPRFLKFVDFARHVFDRIFVTLSSDTFYSFFKDEARMADFHQLKIEPLTLGQQEQLIRKRLALSDTQNPLTDGEIDRIEDRVNSVVISEKILPRYPFYVLAILQSYEAYMPTNLAVTSYGHCYQALILANLILSGISEADNDVNSCFNFAEHLAFARYRHLERRIEVPFDYRNFVKRYRKRFVIKDPIINRLQRPPYGIVTDDGSFRTEYMYYYFLAKFLAGNKEEGAPIVAAMCENSHRESNFLTLLFTIHHTRDDSIIDDILIRTMVTMEAVQPAVLDRDETRRFGGILDQLPANILSSSSVGETRLEERDGRTEVEESESYDVDEPIELDEASPVNRIYRVLKNNKIMGQVLRNRYGNLEKSMVEEIVEIIADSGLRLVNMLLRDEDEISRLAHFIKSKEPKWDIDRIRQRLEHLSFIWTMVNIEHIVDAINVPEIRDAVDSVVTRRGNPAYDLIGYFSQLDVARELTQGERDQLADLLKKYDYTFLRRVLSIRTQHYMNTHRTKAPLEQAICSLLKIKYQPRMFHPA